MRDLPKSWDDVFYLTRKELNKDPDLPNFSLNEIKQIHYLFWKAMRQSFNSDYRVTWLNKFVTFWPRYNKIEREEKRLIKIRRAIFEKRLKEKYEKEKGI